MHHTNNDKELYTTGLLVCDIPQLVLPVQLRETNETLFI